MRIAGAVESAQRFRSSPRPLLAQREDGDWNSKPAKQLVEQSSFLPIGVVRRAQPDENVIRVECGEGILECKEWIVGSDGSARLRSKLLDLAQDRLKALVGLLARLVGFRSQPPRTEYDARIVERARLVVRPRGKEWRYQAGVSETAWLARISPSGSQRRLTSPSRSQVSGGSSASTSQERSAKLK